MPLYVSNQQKNENESHDTSNHIINVSLDRKSTVNTVQQCKLNTAQFSIYSQLPLTVRLYSVREAAEATLIGGHRISTFVHVIFIKSRLPFFHQLFAESVLAERHIAAVK